MNPIVRVPNWREFPSMEENSFSTTSSETSSKSPPSTFLQSLPLAAAPMVLFGNLFFFPFPSVFMSVFIHICVHVWFCEFWCGFCCIAVLLRMLRRRKKWRLRELRMHLITGLMLRGPCVKSSFLHTWITKMSEKVFYLFFFFFLAGWGSINLSFNLGMSYSIFFPMCRLLKSRISYDHLIRKIFMTSILHMN